MKKLSKKAQKQLFKEHLVNTCKLLCSEYVSGDDRQEQLSRQIINFLTNAANPTSMFKKDITYLESVPEYKVYFENKTLVCKLTIMLANSYDQSSQDNDDTINMMIDGDNLSKSATVTIRPSDAFDEELWKRVEEAYNHNKHELDMNDFYTKGLLDIAYVKARKTVFRKIAKTLGKSVDKAAEFYMYLKDQSRRIDAMVEQEESYFETVASFAEEVYEDEQNYLVDVSDNECDCAGMCDCDTCDCERCVEQTDTSVCNVADSKIVLTSRDNDWYLFDSRMAVVSGGIMQPIRMSFEKIKNIYGDVIDFSADTNYDNAYIHVNNTNILNTQIIGVSTNLDDLMRAIKDKIYAMSCNTKTLIDNAINEIDSYTK